MTDEERELLVKTQSSLAAALLIMRDMTRRLDAAGLLDRAAMFDAFDGGSLFAEQRIAMTGLNALRADAWAETGRTVLLE